ncbi:MAG: DUF5684 domain-containing protein [Rubripirellula sp.]|jgi:hypothetical protein
MQILTAGLLAQEDMDIQFPLDPDGFPDNAAPEATAAALAVFGVFWLISFLFSLILIAGLWKVFSKAGKPGWAAIIPIYNIIVMLEITGKPLWWIVLFLIPVVNLIAPLIVMILVYATLAERFGKGVGTIIGLILVPFIFIPILGFGSSTYQADPAPNP